jgi:excisionase family DNA binding protein
MSALTIEELRAKLFVTATDVAALMGVDQRTVRRGIEDGAIPAVRLGRIYRIPVPAFLALCGLAEDSEAKITASGGEP